MSRPLILAAVAATTLGGAALVPLAGAQPAADIAQPAPAAAIARTISVTGVGRSAAAPDLAVLSLSVVTDAASSREALDKNNTGMTAVIAALKSLGYGVTDIQTVGLGLNPTYQYGDATPKLVGYTATNGLTLKVKDIARLGEILDLTVTAGVNRVDSLTFDIANKDAALSEARVAAVKDARAKAELMATALGVALGRPVSLSESYVTDRPVAMQTMNAAAASSVPIAAGQVGLEAQVTVVFELI